MKENRGHSSSITVCFIRINHPTSVLIYTERSNESQCNDHAHRSRDCCFPFPLAEGITFAFFHSLPYTTNALILPPCAVDFHVTCVCGCAIAPSPTSNSVHHIGRGCSHNFHRKRRTSAAISFLCQRCQKGFPHIEWYVG